MKGKVAPAAAATIRHVPRRTKQALKRAILDLPKDSLGTKGVLDVKPLKSSVATVPIYRLRVRNWRVVYLHRGRWVEVVRVFHRRNGYGWMDRLEW